MSNRRTRGISASPLTWLEIDGWQRVTRQMLTTFELACVQALDVEFLKEDKGRDSIERQQ